jgi:hypothetical protein
MEETSDAPIQYRVSIWEGIAIFAGAVFLVAIGLAGLGIKAMNNAFNPKRAEAIAQSMVGYEIPGGSKGLFGTNIGGGKIAVVTGSAILPSSPSSTLSPSASGNASIPEIELLVARIPVDEKTDPPDSEAPPDSGTFFPGFSFSYQTEGAFQVNRSQTAHRLFCGVTAPVTIQEGTLTLPDQSTSVPAVRYETKVDLNADTHVVILSTVGQNAEVNANTVFQSIKCR